VVQLVRFMGMKNENVDSAGRARAEKIWLSPSGRRAAPVPWRRPLARSFTGNRARDTQ
jgi:hypothetical protein